MATPNRYIVQTFTRGAAGVEPGQRIPAETANQARLIARALVPAIVGAAVVELDGPASVERVLEVAGELPSGFTS